MPEHQLIDQELHFDEVAVAYDDTLPEHVMAHLLDRRVRLAQSLKPSGRLLDVGCGTGVFLSAMGSGAYEAVGVDVSEGMVERARARRITADKSSAAELPFDSGSFDLVVCIAVLHHLIDPLLVTRSLREMARVLSPGGAVMVWDHNPLNPYWKLLMRKVPQDQGDERLVPARRIVRPLKDAGLGRVAVQRRTWVADFVPPGGLGPAVRLEALLEKAPGLRLLGAHNVVTGIKPA